MPPRDINGLALIVYSKAYRIGGVGTVVVGGILKGTLNADDVLMTGINQVYYFFNKKLTCD